MEQTQNMPCHVLQCGAFSQPGLDVGKKGTEHVQARGEARFGTKELRIHLLQQPWILVGLAPDHNAIHMIQHLQTLLERADAAVEDDAQLRKALLETKDPRIVQWWHLTVLF